MRPLKTPLVAIVLLLASLDLQAQNCMVLSSAQGTDNQTVCINTPITPIVYATLTTVTGVIPTGLPAGVTGSLDLINHIYTLSGSPSVNGSFTFVLRPVGCDGLVNGFITVNANPTLSLASPIATTNQSVCVNMAITNILYSVGGGATGATVSGLPSGVNYNYNSGVLTISGSPSVAGTFPYTVTTTGPAPCSPLSLYGTITANPNASISLTSAAGTNNQTVCLNTPITTITYSIGGGGTGANVSGLPTGVSGSFNSGTYTISGTPSVSGTFNYTVTTTGTCSQTNATGTINVTQNAVITLTSAVGTNNQTVCAGSPITNITYSITGGGTGATVTGLPAGVTGVYNAGVYTISGTPTVAGIYNYTVNTTGVCTQTSATGTITVIAIPLATAANNGPVCVGSALTLTGGPAGMTTYAWTGPNIFTSAVQSPQVSASATLAMSGRYRLTVTNSNGCRDTASTLAYVLTVPVANAGTGGNECDHNFVLNAVPSSGTGLWTVVSGPGTAAFAPNANAANATVTVSAYGTYIFRWTETNGPCSSSGTVTVNFYQQPVANAGTDANECDLTRVFNAVPSAGTGTWTIVSGPGTATYVPDEHSATATATVSTYGQYDFRWTETNGTCSSNATVTVNFNQQPVANAGTGGNNCGLEFNLKAVPSVGTGTWTRVSGPGTATFTPNATTATARVTVTAYGTYSFRWTEVNGSCSSNASISVVFIQSPSANAGSGGDECDKNFALNAVLTTGTGTWSLQTGPGTATFTPNANQPNATVTVSQFGSYDFLWTVQNSTCTTTDIINVKFHDIPAVSAGDDLAVCKGSSIQLSATGSGTFLWTPANVLNNAAIQNPLATPLVTTTFTVNLTDQYNCKNSDQVVVEVLDKPVADAGPDQELDYIFETLMQAVPVSSPNEGSWTILSGTGQFSDDKDATATVSDLSLGNNSFLWTVSNGVCPDALDTVNITINNLIIPTLITPNQDGKNDYFMIRGIQTLGTTSLTVFDRWGARVYENSRYDNSWDGTDINGQELPPDTYFFILKPEKSKVATGYIVIRR
jgi:trimeric autotransporter adhesin